MKLFMKNVTNELPEIEQVKYLYEDSFPESERIPFDSLLSEKDTGLLEVFAIYFEEQLCGMVVVSTTEKAVYVNYLAISPNMQGKGCGSEIIKELQRQKDGKDIYLFIEGIYTGAPELSIRNSRRKFYLKNGLYDTGFFVIVPGNDERFDIISNRHDCDFDALQEAFNVAKDKEKSFLEFYKKEK